MREIKFRGKAKHKDHLMEYRWIYGDLITNDTTIKIRHKGRFGMYDTEVIDVTVGQYTRIKDKYDHDIYEGDIVSSGLSKGVVMYDSKNALFIVKKIDESVDKPLYLYCSLGIEITGSIWDIFR